MVRHLSGKRLELLKEAFSKISRVAVFVDANTLTEVLQETQQAAQRL
jgi:hypothetical protein